MTDPADFARDEQLLPGLDDPAPHESQLKRAVRRSLTQLQALGMVDETNALHMQLLLDLAETVDAGRRAGKATAAAMAANAMLATWLQLVPEAGGGEDDEWTKLVAEFRGSAPPPRDPAEP